MKQNDLYAFEIVHDLTRAIAGLEIKGNKDVIEKVESLLDNYDKEGKLAIDFVRKIVEYYND